MASSRTGNSQQQSMKGDQVALHCLHVNNTPRGQPTWVKLPLQNPDQAPRQLCAMENCVLMRDVAGNVFKIEKGRFTKLPLQGPASQISTGPSHAVILMKTGEVVCYGDNTFGQCGLDSLHRSVNPPKPPMQIHLGKQRVHYVAAGIDQSAVILSDGSIVKWGGQYVDITPVENTVVEYDRSAFDEPIVQLEIGLNHFAVVDEAGKLWHCGDFGKTGRRAGVRPSIDPVCVNSLEGLPVKKALCGPDYTIALTKDGKLFRYGRVPTSSTALWNTYNARLPQAEGTGMDKIVILPPSEAITLEPSIEWEDIDVFNPSRSTFWDFISRRDVQFRNLAQRYPQVVKTLKKMESIDMTHASEFCRSMWMRGFPAGSFLGTNYLRHAFALDPFVSERPLWNTTIGSVLRSFFISHVAQTIDCIYFIGTPSSDCYPSLTTLVQPFPSSEISRQMEIEIAEKFFSSIQDELNHDEPEEKVDASEFEFQNPSKKVVKGKASNVNPLKSGTTGGNTFALLDEDEVSDEGTPVENGDGSSDAGQWIEHSDPDVCQNEYRLLKDSLSSPPSSLLAGLWIACQEIQWQNEKQLSAEIVANSLVNSSFLVEEYRNAWKRINPLLTSKLWENTCNQLEPLISDSGPISTVKHSLQYSGYSGDELIDGIKCVSITWECLMLRHASDCMAAFGVFQNIVSLLCEWLEHLQEEWDTNNLLPPSNPGDQGEQEDQSGILKEERKQLSCRKRGPGNREREKASRSKGSKPFGRNLEEELAESNVVDGAQVTKEITNGIEGIGYTGKKGDTIGGGGYITREQDDSPAGKQAQSASAFQEAATARLFGKDSYAGETANVPGSTTLGQFKRLLCSDQEETASADEEHSVESTPSRGRISETTRLQRRMRKLPQNNQLSPSRSCGDLHSRCHQSEDWLESSSVDDAMPRSVLTESENNDWVTPDAICCAIQWIMNKEDRTQTRTAAETVLEMSYALKSLEIFRKCNDHVLACISATLLWAASRSWGHSVTSIDPEGLRNSLSLHYDVWSDMLRFLHPFKPCLLTNTQDSSSQDQCSYVDLVYRFYQLPDYLKTSLFSLNKKENELQSGHNTFSLTEQWQSSITEPIRRISHGIFCPMTVEDILRKGPELRKLEKKGASSCSIEERFVRIANNVVPDPDLYCASCGLEHRNWWEANAKKPRDHVNHFYFKYLSRLVGDGGSCSSSTQASRGSGRTGVDSSSDEHDRNGSPVHIDYAVAADSNIDLTDAKVLENKKNRRSQQKRNKCKAARSKKKADHNKVKAQYCSVQEQSQRQRVNQLKKVIDAVKGDSLLQTRSGQVLPVHREILQKRFPNIEVHLCSSEESKEIHWHRFPWLKPESTDILTFPWELRDTPDHLLPELLSYAYRGMPNVSVRTALPLLVASSALNCVDLRETAEHFLISSRFASIHTVSYIISLAQQTNAHGLFSFARALAVYKGVSLEEALNFEKPEDTEFPNERKHESRGRTYSVGDVSSSTAYDRAPPSPWEQDKMNYKKNNAPSLVSRLRQEAKNQKP